MTRILTTIVAVFLLASCGRGSDETLETSAAAAGAGADGSLTESELAAAPDPGTQEDFEVNVGDRVFFDFDSASLDGEARSILDRQAIWLEQYPGVTVTIEGHADERGTRDYNLALGERRATAAKDYLVALGIPASRLLTISYGEERPVDPAHDAAAYALNRRAVTVVNVVN